MKIKLNELTGTEKQIAYAQKLLKEAIRHNDWYIGDLEEQAEDILADSELLNSVIASGALGDIQKSDITLTFIVASCLAGSVVEDDPVDTQKTQALGKALMETSAHAVIELLK